MTTSQPTHKTADGYDVLAGVAYWDNSLRIVTVTRVASYSETNRNQDSSQYGVTTWWHDTTGGMCDGSRLAKRHPFTGQLAEAPSEVSQADAVAKATDLGTDAGQAAASWVFDGNTTQETYRTVLAGLEDGDPATYGMFREPSFSGEYAGDYTERDLCSELDVDYDQASTEEIDALADAYLEAARESFWSEVERIARQNVDYGEHDCPCCGDATYDSQNLLCSACRDAGCEASTDAGGDTGYTNCGRTGSVDDEGTDIS